MECNKDEAIRAKDIAVRKFTEKDFSGSKKFALKAQTLYPELEGISQMLITLDVYISSENKICGEPDYYGMLGVNPLADDETIKKQYRRRVLLLHPDKNKSVGAEGAFNSVKEAYNVLSDKLKRSAFNTKRHVRLAQKVPLQTRASAPQASVPQPPIVPIVVPVHLKVAAERASRKPYKTRKPRKGGDQEASPSVQLVFPKDDNTFWTVCSGCSMKYEYMRIYVGQTLKCPDCKSSFLAVEISPPSHLAPPQPDKQFRPSVSGASNSFGGPSAAHGCHGSPFPGMSTSDSRPSKKKKVTNGNMGTGLGNGHGGSKRGAETGKGKEWYH